MGCKCCLIPNFRNFYFYSWIIFKDRRILELLSLLKLTVIFLNRRSHHSFLTKNRRAMTRKRYPIQIKMTTIIPESSVTWTHQKIYLHICTYSRLDSFLMSTLSFPDWCLCLMLQRKNHCLLCHIWLSSKYLYSTIIVLCPASARHRHIVIFLPNQKFIFYNRKKILEYRNWTLTWCDNNTKLGQRILQILHLMNTKFDIYNEIVPGTHQSVPWNVTSV